MFSSSFDDSPWTIALQIIKEDILYEIRKEMAKMKLDIIKGISK